jgi:hypothetical protein
LPGSKRFLLRRLLPLCGICLGNHRRAGVLGYVAAHPL